MLLLLQRLRLFPIRQVYLNLLIQSPYKRSIRYVQLGYRMKEVSPLTSDADSPEPAPPIVAQGHPAAWEQNLEEIPTIVNPNRRQRTKKKHANEAALNSSVRPARKRKKTERTEIGPENGTSTCRRKCLRKLKSVDIVAFQLSNLEEPSLIQTW
jgi:hypothetical protein